MRIVREVIVRVLAAVFEVGAAVGRFMQRVLVLVHRQRERAYQQINHCKQKCCAAGAKLSHRSTAERTGQRKTACCHDPNRILSGVPIRVNRRDLDATCDLDGYNIPQSVKRLTKTE